MLEAKNLSAGYPGRAVLAGVSLAARPGRVLALLGPNGCGKSTLLRTMAGLLPPLGGEVLLDGRRDYSPRQAAQRVAYLPQSRTAPNITVRRLVLHGRFPYLSYPRRYGREDYEAVDRALAAADALDLADRPLPELSGGQRQKAYLAMALAQETEAILMDEPTTFLDIRHQLEVLALVRRLAEEGRGVVLALHDLCLALTAADDVAVLGEGRLLALGGPEAVYQSKVLERVMGVRLDRSEGPGGRRYFCQLPEEG
ncbi:ABC transporter ATP-binding protein [uncultured Oscillibacter sp.]|jgi:iron complex transport system ATP-binding protein|uniref:ABC transporter ATP-binding protein n=1 Tax=uncultured Oscillibacter sp. TaxID=876091 RepID=UPI00216EEA68|nr:ABC transporter ATP-binding protein [uncultured Oscillibacter sp.]MCI9300722.1 ABC transporter ATP-binding protein [Oscillibacter sp.]MCI9461024.1 ABC transporter ATP-binding protein [Oscillibacter sp.]